MLQQHSQYARLHREMAADFGSAKLSSVTDGHRKDAVRPVKAESSGIKLA
jgi:hypothetical protein